MGDGHITVTDKKRVFHFPLSKQEKIADAKDTKCSVETPLPAPPPPPKKQKKKATPSTPAVSSSSGRRKDVDPPTIDSKRQKSIDPPDEPEPPPDEPDPPPDSGSISCGCSDCSKEKCACEHCKTRY
jgi:hypothetical protein